ncbi:MAG: GNAT family N-acetyltransferase [Pseudoclavibacter sp.]
MSSSGQLPSRRQASRQARSREANVVVRPIVRGDFFAWHDAFAAFLAESGQQVTETHALRVWQWLESTPARLEAFIALLGDRVVGLLHFHETVVPASGNVEFQLQDLYEDPEVRMRGVGDELIGAVYAEAARRGISRISTFTQGTDEESLRYWDRLGSRSGVVGHDMKVQALA